MIHLDFNKERNLENEQNIFIYLYLYSSSELMRQWDKDREEGESAQY